MKTVKAFAERLWKKESRFEHLVVLLIVLWMFLIPFGKGEKVPVILLAILGLIRLIQTKGRCATTPVAKSFFLLLSLYLIPIATSLTDAVSLKAPLTVLLMGLASGLAGTAIIDAAMDQRTLNRITVFLVAIIGFWFLDAGIQAVFSRDIFGLLWEGDRLSGPFLKKTQMGYYSGPFSALLLMFALQKKWKPVFLWALFVFTSVIVLLNNSRGGWVMYGVVAAVFGYTAFIAPMKHRFLMCVALLILGATLAFGLYTSSDTLKKRVDQTLLIEKGTRKKINRALSERLAVWEAAVGIIKDHPINGIGARNYRLMCAQYWPEDLKKRSDSALYPHQLVLEYAVGTGAIGVLGLLISMGICLKWWQQADAGQRRTAAGYALTLLAIYFPLNTHKAFFSSELSASLWIMIALYTVSIHNVYRSESSDNSGSLPETQE